MRVCPPRAMLQSLCTKAKERVDIYIRDRPRFTILLLSLLLRPRKRAAAIAIFAFCVLLYRAQETMVQEISAQPRNIRLGDIYRRRRCKGYSSEVTPRCYIESKEERVGKRRREREKRKKNSPSVASKILVSAENSRAFRVRA